MTKTEIRNIIDKYGLFRHGDKVATRKKGVDPKAFVAEVGPAKAEILIYWEEEEKAQRGLRELKERNFESIEGVREIREARRAYYRMESQNYKAWERGDGIYIDCRKEEETLKAVEAKYPLAVWALDIQHRVEEHGSMTDQAFINNRAYESLRAGDDPKQVKDRYEKETAENVDKHIWD